MFEAATALSANMSIFVQKFSKCIRSPFLFCAPHLVEHFVITASYRFIRLVLSGVLIGPNAGKFT